MALHRSAIPALVALAVAAPALADPTDIIEVPTADTLAPGQFEVGVVQGVANFDDGDLTTTLQSEFGITRQVEAGLDVHHLFNGDVELDGDVKLQLREPAEGRVGFAIGATDVSFERDTFLYGVATTRFGQASVTGGLGWEDEAGVLLGAQYQVTPTIRTYAEYMSMNGGYVGAGASYAFTNQVAASAWYQHLDETDEDRIQVELTFRGNFDGLFR